VLPVFNSADIILKRIHPNISHKIFVKWDWNTPGKARFWAAYAQVVQRFFQKSQHFVSAKIRQNPAWVFIYIVNQSLLIFAHFKEIIFFAQPFNRSTTNRVFAINKLSLLKKSLFAN